MVNGSETLVLLAFFTQSSILHPLNDLPALLLAGGPFVDLSGGLLVFILIFSVLKIEFSIQGSSEKRSKK